MRRALRILVAVGLGILVGVVPARAANDPGAPQQWNMAVVGAEAAWATGTGKGITVAVVDTGVNLTHEDLAARIVPGWNFVEDNATPQDDNGHGTHVAGIVGAIANNGKGVIGVAPDVRIMPVRVLHGPDGRGTGADVEAGIKWAADHGAHVINLSLGEDLQGLNPFGPGLVAAIEYAWGKGAICVVAAGNDTLQSSGFDAETPAVVVTATTRNDTQAQYASNVGFLFKRPQWGMAAPGGAGNNPPNEDDILSTYWTASTPDTYARGAGTSMATPHVSGAVAILRSLGLTKDQATDRLIKTARDLGNPGYDNTYGHGRLDVAKAVTGLQPAGGTNTPTTTAAAGTTTTTRRATTTTSRSGGSGIKIVTPTTEGTRRGTSGSTTTSAAPGSPTLPGDEVVLEEEAEDEYEAAGEPPADDGGGSAVWPAALVALLALGGAGAGLQRIRRG
jgi:subtilisin family serine protease